MDPLGRDLDERAAPGRSVPGEHVDEERERGGDPDEQPARSSRQPLADRQPDERGCDDRERQDPGKRQDPGGAPGEGLDGRSTFGPLDRNHADRSRGGEEPADGGEEEQVAVAAPGDDGGDEGHADQRNETQVQEPACDHAGRRAALARSAGRL